MALASIALQSPFVQTKLTGYAATKLGEKTGYQVSLKHINIDWFDALSIDKLQLADPNGVPIIYSRHLKVDFNLRKLLTEKDIVLDDVSLDSTRFSLTRYPGQDYFNFDYFIDSLRNNSDTTHTPKPPKFIMKHATLHNSFFSLNEMERDSIKNGFDDGHFKVTELNADLRNFMAVHDTVNFTVNALKAVDSATQFRIHKMQTHFHYAQSGLFFDNIRLQAGNSYISDTVRFHYENAGQLGSFVDSVKIEAHLDSTSIDAQDLALFAPQVSPYKDKVTISGNIDGFVRDLDGKKINLHFGNKSQITGDISFDGLPDIQETFIDFRLSRAVFYPQDLAQYVSDSSTNSKLQNLGYVDFNGEFLGFPYDFVANGTFNTGLGRVESDINLKLATDPAKAKYRGTLSVFNFNLGKLLGMDSLIQHVQMNGTVNGTGLTVKSANFDLNANFGLLELKSYPYQNITTKAHFAREFFEGDLKIDDPNLKLDANGSVDLRESKKRINITAKLDTASLKKLKLSNDQILVKADLAVDATGLALDSIKGKANLKQVYLYYNGRELQLDSLNAVSRFEKGNREFAVNTNLFNVSLTGDYQFTSIFNDASTLFQEFWLNIENDSTHIAQYYHKKQARDKANEIKDYTVNYALQLTNINPIVHLFAPQITISPKTTLTGYFQNGHTSIFNLSTSFDSLRIDQNHFVENQVELTLSKIQDSTQVLAMGYVYSDGQKWSNFTNSHHLETQFIWNNNVVNFNSHVEQAKYDNKADISGLVQFEPNKTIISFDTSRIKAFQNVWKFYKDNQLTIEDRKLTFQKVGLFSNNQDILISGVVSDSIQDKLTLQVNEFDLNSMSAVLDRKFSGKLDGFVTVQDFYRSRIINADIRAMNFTVDKFLVGNIIGTSDWQDEQKTMQLKFTVDRLEKHIIDIGGSYQPLAETSSLDLKATLLDANLKIAEPFVDDIFSQISGTLSGDFTVTGTPSYPILKGVGNVNNGSLLVNYLNTQYGVNGKVTFDQDKITMTSITLRDDQNNEAQLRGQILHNGFSDLYLDLHANMQRFKVLNTTSSDNSLYYGTAVVSGTVDFIGYTNNMTINATATSEKGTRFFIPVASSGSSISQEDFIHFVNPEDTVGQKKKNVNEVGKVDLNNINLNFDLDITTDAYAEIIFDIKSGDIIRGRGNGKLNLEINSNGEFLMFGDYTIEEGGYNFTLGNIINKEFSIQKGSRISWDGDPYQGNLNIKAIYQQNVSLAPILQDTSLTNIPDIQRRYPTNVVLDLTGNLLSPEVNFDINITDYPETVFNPKTGTSVPLSLYVRDFESRIETDKDELKRQVFSLIILKRFSPPNAFAVSGSVGSSVSEFLSNQLSYWITQFDENLEIDVDLSSFDQEALNTFQLRLSYSFLNGRLRVTRAGTLSSGTNQNTNDLTGILGDWTVEYLLTKDGKLRVKMYNKTNYNAYNSALGTASVNAGASLIYVQSFNQLKEIFKKRREKAAEKEDLPAQKQKKEDSKSSDSPPSKQNPPLKKEEDDTQMP